MCIISHAKQLTLPRPTQFCLQRLLNQGAATRRTFTYSLILNAPHTMTILQTLHYYYDRAEEHLPFKPSKWDRKWKIAILCLALIFLIMAIVAFALHDRVFFPL